MAIRHRRGDYNNFEPSKMVAGELAFVNSSDPNVEDGKAVYGTFTGGVTKRLCTYSEVSGLVDQAVTVKNDVTQMKNDVSQMKTDVTQLTEDAEEYKDLSKSYAVGTNNVARAGDSTDNSKYYKEWVENALDRSIPEFAVDFTTGDLLYTGGVFTFTIDENGHLNWYM